MISSKSGKRERGLIQNPARERKDLLKIQQERERRYSKSGKRERRLIQNPARKLTQAEVSTPRWDAGIKGLEADCVRERDRERERTEEVEDGDDW